MAKVLTDSVEMVDAKSLIRHPRNPRRGDVKLIRGLIGHNGFVGAVVVQRSTRHIIVGNHRVEAAIAEGIEKVPVMWADVDDQRAIQIMLADNKASDDARDDRELLFSLLRDLSVPAAAGFTSSDMAVLASLVTGDVGSDCTPLVHEDPHTATGQVLKLGHHTLVCGDSTDDRSWIEVGSRDRAMCVTSPPYALGSNHRLRAPLASGAVSAYAADADTITDWRRLMVASSTNAHRHCLFSSFVVQMLADNKVELMRWVAEDIGDRLVDLAVWDKGRAAPALAPRCMSSRFELVVMFGDRGATRALPLAAEWRGEFDNVVEIDPGHNPFADVHRAVFPLDLPKWLIRVAGSAAETVVDCFAGTGTTLIAAAEARKRAVMIERDPLYCDVIRRRWTSWAKSAGVDPGPGALE